MGEKARNVGGWAMDGNGALLSDEVVDGRSPGGGALVRRLRGNAESKR